MSGTATIEDANGRKLLVRGDDLTRFPKCTTARIRTYMGAFVESPPDAVPMILRDGKWVVL